MTNSAQSYIRITQELDEWLRDEAQLQERTVGQIVEEALRDVRAAELLNNGRLRGAR